MTVQLDQPVALATARTLIRPAVERAAHAYCPALEKVVGYHAGWLEADGGPAAGPRGGKAIRPALVLLAAQAFGLGAEAALPAAVCVEFVHDFSLLHDDVMDGDRTRRHRPAAWTVFGTDAAILAGDALLAAAYQSLLESAAPDPAEAVSVLSLTVQRLIRGQARDLEFERRGDVTLAEAVAMAGDKTAALFACCCALGAWAAGAPAGARRAMARVGEELGLAFQLVDDLLGIWGGDALGKPVLADLRRRKKSLPVLAALRAEGPHAARLGEFYADPGADGEEALRQAAELVEAAGGRQWARTEAARRLESAARLLDELELPPSARAEFGLLIGFLRERTS